MGIENFVRAEMNAKLLRNQPPERVARIQAAQAAGDRAWARLNRRQTRPAAVMAAAVPKPAPKNAPLTAEQQRLVDEAVARYAALNAAPALNAEEKRVAERLGLSDEAFIAARARFQ